MTKHEATVEVLTAEVRVLMVGSRQVTLSVYNQLDIVDDSDIEPFGRVCPRSSDGGLVYVIGRHRGDGTLVRSMRPSAIRVIYASIMTEVEGRMEREVCGSLAILRENGPGFYYDKAAHEAAAARYPDFARWWTGRVDELQDYAAEWKRLPLIVLAGLR